jgi:hypothetical protein
MAAAADDVDTTTQKSEWVQVHKSDIPADLYTYLQKGGYIRYENPYFQPQKVSNFMKNVVYFGKVTDITLSKITDNAEKFSETKLGNLSLFLIAYKTIGSDILSFVLHILTMIIFMVLFVGHWRKRLVARSEQLHIDNDLNATYKVYVPTWWHLLVWFIVYLILSWIII